MADVALWDLVAPYFLLGNAAGNAHAALAVLSVDEYEEAADASASVMRGRARFHGNVQAWIDPQNFSFGVRLVNGPGHPADDPARHSPWIDLQDTTVDFQLLAPRVGSAIVPVPNNAPPTPTGTVVTALGTPGQASDYPSTEFVLNLVITSAVLRPPFLHPAALTEDGTLAPDPDHTEVRLTLPKIKLEIRQGSTLNSQPAMTLQSFGASGLDDPGDIGVAQTVTMDPPYAFIGPGNVVGFGFRSAVLDLSNASTPPDVLSQFGFDANWTGVYFPEIRLFVAPQGVQGWAVNGGAHNLLLGLGASAGITGDFDLDVIDNGEKLNLGARFYRPNGQPIAMRRINAVTGMVTLPDHATLVVDVEGGRPPTATVTQIDKDPSTNQPVVDVDMSKTATRTITIHAGSASPLTITAQHGSNGGASGSTTTIVPGSVPAATVTKSTTTQGTTQVNHPRVVIDSQTDTTVTVRLEDNSPAAWSVNGAPVGAVASRTTLPLAAVAQGPATAKVQADVTGPSTTAPIYFHYDEPDQLPDAELDAYALNRAMTHTTESTDETIQHGWIGGVDIMDSAEHASAMRAIEQANPAAKVTIVGFASWEGDANKDGYNKLLSERRAKVARRIYEQVAGPVSLLDFDYLADGSETAKTTGGQPRRHWWRVELLNAVSPFATTTIAEISRPPVPMTTVITPAKVDRPPPGPARPDFLRSLGAKVRIIRDDFIAVELHGSVDVETAAEQTLRSTKPTGFHVPDRADGIVDFRGVFTRNPGSDEWAFDLLFGANPADLNGLAMTGTMPGEPVGLKSGARDLLGLFTLLFPVFAKVPTKPSESLLVLEGGALAALGLATTGWFNVQRIIWYGGEVLVRQHLGDWSTTILLDVEAAVSAEIDFLGKTLLTIAADKPLVARYKAIGVRFGVDNSDPKLPKPVFAPVFDSSKGYTLDIARPGSVQVADPFGRLLRVDSARISRTNPTMLEVQLGSSADLGVVALDRVGVRVTFDEQPAVELTDLAARIDVPGVIAGSGYLRIEAKDMAGRLDLTLVPLKLRIAAALRITDIDADKGGPATGVAVSITVEFPVAIPLWTSGLGLYGVIGLFAMHFSRNEKLDEGSTTKALSWLQRCDPQGDPTNVTDKDLWKPEIDHWAFGVGALVGTLGSPTVFNMKGVFMLELPGPRLLLMMKANLLSPIPAQTGPNAEGTLLAVIDVDAARSTLTIGIVIDYSLEPILALRIPVEAFFGDKPENWHIYLGQSKDHIRAKLLGVFDGSGYLMIGGVGKSMELIPDLQKYTSAGFAIAAGLHVSMLWGSKKAKVYAELAIGFDALVGFSPLIVAGVIYGRGELRAWIISISASATLKVRLGQPPGKPEDGGYEISGEVCGSIHLLLFKFKGCVPFKLTSSQAPTTVIPDLVEGVTLVSRSPALVHGTGSDDPIDGGIGDAIESAVQPTGPIFELLPVVPIDAIPVVMFGAPPMADNVKSFDLLIGGASGGRKVNRSTDVLEYTLASVSLTGGEISGFKPATWWTLRPPDQANETSQLALLSWTPTPTPNALLACEALTENVEDRWGTVCDHAAPPTPVLWTFRFEALGPCADGWSIDGEAWPDPPKTVRSAPTPTVLDVQERWRCGDAMVDPFRGILAGEVVGALVACPRPAAVPERGQPDRRMLVAAGATTMGTKFADPLDEPQITIDETVRRLRLGLPISRAAQSQVIVDQRLPMEPDAGQNGVSPVTSTGGRCASRVLAAPRFDTLALPVGDPIRDKDIDKRWKLLGFRPGDLADAVVLTPGVFDRARVLLFVSRRLLRGDVLVRAVAADGDLVSETKVDASQVVSWATLPTTWAEATGPWDDDVALVMNHLLALPLDHYVAVLVDIEGALKADEIHIGLDAAQNVIHAEGLLDGPSYYVAALEALLASEIARSDHDSHEADKNHAVLEAALGAHSAATPLMTPNTTYRIDVEWTAIGSAVDRPLDFTKQGLTQTFWFRTDAEAPERLAPWVLVAIPYDGERHVFGGEPLQIAFATPNVSERFAAYGYRLEVRLSASSARHPDPAELPFGYPLILETAVSADSVPVGGPEPLSIAVPGAVFSPWEDTVTDVVDPACVDIDGSRVRHSQTKIPIPLHPSTDYLFDIWRVPEEGTDGTEMRVFRRGFSTSRYETLAALASYCLGSRVVHRAVPAGLAAKVLTAFGQIQPEGEALDDVLRDTQPAPGDEPTVPVGIEPMPVPDRPRIVVWWEQADGAPPQPTAVVIDACEPLWRTRERASLKTLPDTDIKHWELLTDEWISPQESVASDGIVQRIVRAPGGQRAIAILKQESRGKHVALTLLRRAFTESYLDGPLAVDQAEPLADVSLLTAPWEEN